MIPIARPLRPKTPQRILAQLNTPSNTRLLSSSRHGHRHSHRHGSSHHLSRVDDHEIVQLANKTQHPLSLTDLVKYVQPLVLDSNCKN